MFVPTNESGKLYKLDDHILCAVSGITADANYLVDDARLRSKQHTYSMKTPIYVEEIVKYIADRKHTLTMFGSSRPFGVALMYAGYDNTLGFQLYCSDPSGNYAAWKANATGKNNAQAVSTLKEDYVEGMTLMEGIVMAAKVLGKSMDVNKPDANRFEIGVVTLDDNRKVVQRRVAGAELDKVLTDAKVFENLDKK